MGAKPSCPTCPPAQPCTCPAESKHGGTVNASAPTSASSGINTSSVNAAIGGNATAGNKNATAGGNKNATAGGNKNAIAGGNKNAIAGGNKNAIAGGNAAGGNAAGGNAAGGNAVAAGNAAGGNAVAAGNAAASAAAAAGASPGAANAVANAVKVAVANAPPGLEAPAAAAAAEQAVVTAGGNVGQAAAASEAASANAAGGNAAAGGNSPPTILPEDQTPAEAVSFPVPKTLDEFPDIKTFETMLKKVKIPSLAINPNLISNKIYTGDSKSQRQRWISGGCLQTKWLSKGCAKNREFIGVNPYLERCKKFLTDNLYTFPVFLESTYAEDIAKYGTNKLNKNKELNKQFVIEYINKNLPVSSGYDQYDEKGDIFLKDTKLIGKVVEYYSNYKRVAEMLNHMHDKSAFFWKFDDKMKMPTDEGNKIPFLKDIPKQGFLGKNNQSPWFDKLVADYLNIFSEMIKEAIAKSTWTQKEADKGNTPWRPVTHELGALLPKIDNFYKNQFSFLIKQKDWNSSRISTRILYWDNRIRSKIFKIYDDYKKVLEPLLEAQEPPDYLTNLKKKFNAPLVAPNATSSTIYSRKRNSKRTGRKRTRKN